MHQNPIALNACHDALLAEMAEVEKDLSNKLTVAKAFVGFAAGYTVIAAGVLAKELMKLRSRG